MVSLSLFIDKKPAIVLLSLLNYIRESIFTLRSYITLV